MVQIFSFRKFPQLFKARRAFHSQQQGEEAEQRSKAELNWHMTFGSLNMSQCVASLAQCRWKYHEIFVSETVTF